MATSRTGVVWRYLPKGKVKHALSERDGSFPRASSLCGTSPQWFVPRGEQWWGTGTQAEYDMVETLPECRRCTKLLTPTAPDLMAALAESLRATP